MAARDDYSQDLSATLLLEELIEALAENSCVVSYDIVFAWIVGLRPAKSPNAYSIFGDFLFFTPELAIANIEKKTGEQHRTRERRRGYDALYESELWAAFGLS
jgi:hypothetical protein